MKASELVRLLESKLEETDDMDVFVSDSDGWLHDFRCETRPETFDGFDIAYDEGINLIMTD